ncbi:hypothetical protein [Myxococcus virescens]|uniref:Uncharacterized protein n=1 Tax=Myxococcus virescens TaxID=83456 RepID=A0A511HPJ6_9BACT|nr:hypothetical protein [Myxococcus virescens]GEL75510.1 hypothetical protein MVI01_72940 [Myxococcus virescens]SDD65843.1 hypothetical protein SAMN04488504_102159 [Myxococcus virescens]
MTCVPKLLTTEELDRAKYESTSGDSAQHDWLETWRESIFGHLAALDAQAAKVPEVVRVAEAHGWNGVDNAKHLATFLEDELGALAKLRAQKSPPTPEEVERDREAVQYAVEGYANLTQDKAEEDRAHDVALPALSRLATQAARVPAMETRITELEASATEAKAEFDRGEWVGAAGYRELLERFQKAKSERDAAKQLAEAQALDMEDCRRQRQEAQAKRDVARTEVETLRAQYSEERERNRAKYAEIKTLRERVATLEQRVADQEREKAELRASEGAAVERERQQHARAIEAESHVRELEEGITYALHALGTADAHPNVRERLRAALATHSAPSPGAVGRCCSEGRNVACGTCTKHWTCDVHGETHTPPPRLLEGTDDRGQAEAGPGRAQGAHEPHSEGADVPEVPPQVRGDAAPARPVDSGASVPMVQVGGSGGDVNPPGLLEAVGKTVAAWDNAGENGGKDAMDALEGSMAALRAAFDAAKYRVEAFREPPEPELALKVEALEKQLADAHEAHAVEKMGLQHDVDVLREELRIPPPPPKVWADLRDAVARLPKPSGHSGDEESGEHDADCELCGWEAIQEMAHATRRVPAPLGLLEAVGRVLDLAASPFNGGDTAWRNALDTLRAAYDAAKGGEAHTACVKCHKPITWDSSGGENGRGAWAHDGNASPGCRPEPRVVLADATCPNCKADHEDAAKYRAAVEGIQRARNLLLYPTVTWDETVPEVLRVLAMLVSDAPAPSETLDKARVVEVLTGIIADPESSLDADRACRRVARRLGLSLDTPPSGPGGGDIDNLDGESPAVEAVRLAAEAGLPVRVTTRSRIAPTPTPEVSPLTPDVAWEDKEVRVLGDGTLLIFGPHGWEDGPFTKTMRLQRLARALAEAKRETAHAQGLVDVAARATSQAVRVAAEMGAENMREQAAEECDETANDAEVPAHTREVARLLAKCIRALPLLGKAVRRG